MPPGAITWGNWILHSRSSPSSFRSMLMEFEVDIDEQTMLRAYKNNKPFINHSDLRCLFYYALGFQQVLILVRRVGVRLGVVEVLVLSRNFLIDLQAVSGLSGERLERVSGEIRPYIRVGFCQFPGLF